MLGPCRVGGLSIYPVAKNSRPPTLNHFQARQLGGTGADPGRTAEAGVPLQESILRDKIASCLSGVCARPIPGSPMTGKPPCHAKSGIDEEGFSGIIPRWRSCRSLPPTRSGFFGGHVALQPHPRSGTAMQAERHARWAFSSPSPSCTPPFTRPISGRLG
jgi:hypothetical protein